MQVKSTALYCHLVMRMFRCAPTTTEDQWQVVMRCTGRYLIYISSRSNSIDTSKISCYFYWHLVMCISRYAPATSDIDDIQNGNLLCSAVE